MAKKNRLMNQCTEPFFLWFSSLTASQGMDYDHLTSCLQIIPAFLGDEPSTITSGIDSNMFLGCYGWMIWLVDGSSHKLWVVDEPTFVILYFGCFTG